MIKIMRKESLVERVMKGIKKLFKRDLIKNKIYSLILICIGYCTMKLSGDCTMFILTLILGLPVFFAKKNVIV